MTLHEYLAHHSQGDLAKLLDVHASMVSQWASGRRPISALMARKLEEATDGEIRREHVRPDIFGGMRESDAA